MTGLCAAIDAVVVGQHRMNKKPLKTVSRVGSELTASDVEQDFTTACCTKSVHTTTSGTGSKHSTTRSPNDCCPLQICASNGAHQVQGVPARRACDLNDAVPDRGPESERLRRRKVVHCFYIFSQYMLGFKAVLVTRETFRALGWNLSRFEKSFRILEVDDKLVTFLNAGLDFVLSNKYVYDIRLYVSDKTLDHHKQTTNYSKSYHNASQLVDSKMPALYTKKDVEIRPSKTRDQVLFKGIRGQYPNQPRRLFSLWWLFLLLLTCTGNLFNVSQFQRAVRGSLSRLLSGGSDGMVPAHWLGAALLVESFGKVSSSQDLNVGGGVMGAIIPPPWANISTNPCAMKSWQLLYWPDHDKCYKIFSQGPCPRGEEVYHDPESDAALCRCEKGRIKHVDTGRCYLAFTRGPCRPREFLQEDSPGSGAWCHKFAACAAGDVYWPADDTCYRQHTRGPCQHGELLHLHSDTGWPTCGCEATMMRMQYWPHADTCHELLSRGPCVVGHVFTYNTTTRSTQCSCNPSLTANYHHETDQCYPLETQGPCPPGHTFSLPKGAKEPLCTCLKGHLLHVPSGTCQRAYTRAVCLSGEFLEPDASGGVGVGRCTSVPCSTSGQLYHPETDRCYPVGSSGPCSKGNLWVYERASSLRGRCHCDEDLVGYWGPHNICYPLGERGPCPSRHVITYSSSRGLACSCDRRRGYTRWKGRCERITAADIIRDLLNSNIMDPSEDELVNSNSVMQARARNFKHTTIMERELSTLPRSTLPMRPTTQSLPITLPWLTTTPSFRSTTPPRVVTSLSGTTEVPILTTPSMEQNVDTHEIITFSRDFPNSIEGEDTQPRADDSDISTRIARLTHRGLITRRTRRPAI